MPDTVSLCIQCKQRKTISRTTSMMVGRVLTEVVLAGIYCEPCGEYARRMEYGPCTLEEMIDHHNGVIDSFREE